MFFLRSFIGLWYISFLSGFVFLRVLRYRASLINEVFVSFALSLGFNYLFTYILGVFRFINFLPYLIFFFLLLLILVFLLIKEKKDNFNDFIHSLWVIVFSLVVLCFLWLLNQFVFRSGSIGWGIDDLFGWGSWALKWYNNKPVFSQPNFYGQLLPITWAVSYIWSGTEVIQFFSRSLMPLFFFGIIGLGFDRWVQKKDNISLISFIFLGWLFVVWRCYPRMTLGIADIPASFLAFASFMLLLQSKEKDDRLSFLISGLIASFSVVTKQYAVIYFCAFWIISLIFFWEKRKDKKWVTMFFITLLISLLWILPFYLKTVIDMKFYKSPEKIVSIGSFQVYNEHVMYWEGENKLFNVLITKPFNFFKDYFLGVLPFIFIILGVLLSTFYLPGLLLLLFVIVPSYFLWAILIAYDIRNFSIGLMFMIYVSGMGYGFILRKFVKVKKLSEIFSGLYEVLESKFIRNKILLAFSIVSIFVILLFCANFYSYDRLLSIQKERQKKYVGDFRDINTMIYSYKEINKNTVIYSDYIFLHYFPDIIFKYGNFTNINELKNVINSKEADFLLITKLYTPSEDVSNYIAECVKNGKIKIATQSENGILYRIEKGGKE